MPLLVKEDEALDPPHVRLFRPQRVGLEPQDVADLIEQSGLRIWDHMLFAAY
jgi:hypothetical protein